MAEEAAEPSPHPPPTVILSLFLSFIFFFFPDLGLYKKWETDRIWIKFVVN